MKNFCIKYWLSGILVFMSLFSLPVLGVEVRLPTDRPGDNITNNGKTQINANEDTLYNTINLVNEYLWWSFWVIAMGMLIYVWYLAITGSWDSKIYKKIIWGLIWIAFGLGIAMLSSALVKIVVNFI